MLLYDITVTLNLNLLTPYAPLRRQLSGLRPWAVDFAISAFRVELSFALAVGSYWYGCPCYSAFVRLDRFVTMLGYRRYCY